MAGSGKFIGSKLIDIRLEIFTHLDSEWISHQDGTTHSYTVLTATPKAYDEESGVLTMEAIAGRIFYLAEEAIEMFWVAGSGFKISENSTSTMRPMRDKKSRDIM